jgi:polyferredoxin
VLAARPVRGAWRRARWWVDTVLVAVLFSVPWIRIGDEPLVLLDIPARRFHVFGLVIFPGELYFLWLLIALLAVALFFFTALAGRLWCGWACPQTVFTDLFAAVARRVQGWNGSRPPPRVAPSRALATHIVWALASVGIGFHLVGYFHSPYTLLAGAWAGRPPLLATAVWFGVSALVWFDLVVLRQAFCKTLCP